MYAHRRQDTAAFLHLADILRRLHAAAPDPRPFAQRIRDADIAANASPRQLRISDDGTSLELPLYWTERGEVATLPIPPSLRDPADVTVETAAPDA